MTLKKPTYRTMWMFPRNIRRIEPWKLVQIASILEACTGNVLSQEVQDGLYAQLAHLGIKVPANPNGVSNSGGMRTYFAQLACLGLFWKDPESGNFSTTEAGDALIAGNDPLRVLRCQLLRMQYPSAYGLGHNVAVSPKLKVKPFVFLVRLLQDSRLEGGLSDEEIAVPVVYARTEADYEQCVEKILKMRASMGSLRVAIDHVSDVRTPRRFRPMDPTLDLEMGIKDAIEVANTAKNYMQAALLIEPNPVNPHRYELTGDAAVLHEIKPWLDEGSKIDPIDPKHTVAWQIRYGRFDKIKSVRSMQKETSVPLDGFRTLIMNRFLSAVSEAPIVFSTESFIKDEALRWGRSEADISRIIAPVRQRRKDIEHDLIMRAACSGGKDARTLEIALAGIFRKLGFEQSEQIGQKVSKRLGGFPDVRVLTENGPFCGFVDAKATTRFSISAADIAKLQTYYKNCWSEFEPAVPSSFHAYVAAGFNSSTQTVLNRLNECAHAYGRPVLAITVTALLDLLDHPNRPSSEKLKKALLKQDYYASAEAIVEACT